MNRRLSILIYHRVLAQSDPLLPELPDVRLFDRHMALVRRCFNVLPLSAAVRQLRQGTCLRARPASPSTTVTPTTRNAPCRYCSATS